MARPLWFVEFLKRNFKRNKYLAKMTRLPIIGKFLEKGFEGDNLTVLPKDETVIQINESIDKQDEFILPSKIVEYFVKKAKYHWIMNFCICRDSSKCENYPSDLGCLFLGEAVLDINPHIGRLVSEQEALEHLRKCRELGLVHVIGKNKLDSVWLGVSDENKLLTICNCCECCCLARGVKYATKRIANVYKKMPGVEVKVTNDCVGCGTCQEVCIVDAIQLINYKAVINQIKCKGCTRCITTCPRNAIKLELKDKEFMEKTIQRVSNCVEI
ncbi:MAG: 4Fe-4S ferredoxin [Candidatus Lokiarchaeota archaeon]|nr:4Fe-4S ferredoxin [Candidatus Lokiarchaeota archaeon]